MKLDPRVRDLLRRSVEAHWEAIEVYTEQAAHLTAWGYPRLAEVVGADPDEEREHLARLLARLELFDLSSGPSGVVAESEPAAWPRHDLPGILAYNLALEESALAIERDGHMAAMEVGDPGSACVFMANLAGSEDGIRTIQIARRKLRDQTAANFLSAYN